MAHLRTDHKTIIRTRLLHQRFGEEQASLKEESDSLAKQCHAYHYREHLDKMLDLPSGWLPTMTQVRAYVPACNQHVELRSSTPMRVLQSDHSYGGLAVTIPAKHQLAAKLVSWADRNIRHQNEFRQTDEKLRLSLQPYKTPASLINAWPEIKSIVESVCGKPGAPCTALAPRFESLNQILGLKPGKEKKS